MSSDEQPSAASSGTISSDRAGSVVLPIHVTRHVKVYPIQKHELATLQAMSGEKTFWAAVAAGAFVFIIDCLWSWCQLPDESKLPPRSIAIIVFAAVVCVFSLGKAEMQRRAANRRLEEILSETEVG